MFSLLKALWRLSGISALNVTAHGFEDSGPLNEK